MRCDGQPTSEMKSYFEFGDGHSSGFQKQFMWLQPVSATCKNPQPEWQDGGGVAT